MGFFKDYESITKNEDARADPPEAKQALTAEDVKSYFEAMKEGLLSELKELAKNATREVTENENEVTGIVENGGGEDGI